MKHKCDGCKYKGEHQEMMFRPFGVCLKFHNLGEAEKAYRADKCPFKKTNFDRINDMSIEEMSNFLMDWAMKMFDGTMPMNVKTWLESEVAE